MMCLPASCVLCVVKITQGPVCLAHHIFPSFSSPVVQGFPDRSILVPESTLSPGRCKSSPASAVSISLLLPDTQSQASGSMCGWTGPCHHFLNTRQWEPCFSQGIGPLSLPKYLFSTLHMESFIRLLTVQSLYGQSLDVLSQPEGLENHPVWCSLLPELV